MCRRFDPGPRRVAFAREIPVSATYPEQMSSTNKFEWHSVLDAPAIAIREPGRDGLEIYLDTMTVPLRDYGQFATANVVTIAGGQEKRHSHVLMSADEPKTFAHFLDDALKRPSGDRTASIFDDGMTFRIQGDRRGSWIVLCRAVPMPGPNDTWETFPEFSFTLGVAALQTAISELETLSAFMVAWSAQHASDGG